MADRSFRSMLIHRCSVVKAAAATGDYGYPDLDWTTGITTTANVPVFVTEPSVSVRAELATLAVQVDYVAYMDYADAPATLKAEGAERTHRITNVTRKSGSSWVSFDPGPFSIVHITDAASRQHHLEFFLQRTS